MNLVSVLAREYGLSEAMGAAAEVFNTDLALFEEDMASIEDVGDGLRHYLQGLDDRVHGILAWTGLCWPLQASPFPPQCRPRRSEVKEQAASRACLSTPPRSLRRHHETRARLASICATAIMRVSTKVTGVAATNATAVVIHANGRRTGHAESGETVAVQGAQERHTRNAHVRRVSLVARPVSITKNEGRPARCLRAPAAAVSAMAPVTYPKNWIPRMSST